MKFEEECDNFHQGVFFLLSRQEAAALLPVESPASVVICPLHHNFNRCNFQV